MDKSDSPTFPGGRPYMPADDAALQDEWLTPNGVTGYLPEGAEIVVAKGQITYPAWRHLDGTIGGWGRDVMVEQDEWSEERRQADGLGGSTPLTVPRTVPLVVPVTDRVRALFAASVLTLVERGWRSWT